MCYSALRQHARTRLSLRTHARIIVLNQQNKMIQLTGAGPYGPRVCGVERIRLIIGLSSLPSEYARRQPLVRYGGQYVEELRRG